MSDLNIAIFGSSGSIGNALSIEYAENNKVNKIFAFSRNDNSKLIHKKIIKKKLIILMKIV